MAATIRRLVPKTERLRADRASEFRALLHEHAVQLDLPMPLMRGLYQALDRQTASRGRWTFIMLSPDQNNAVVTYLVQQSSRPLVAVRLWSMAFSCLDYDTGQILLTRDEMAERLGETPAHVSTVMTELEDAGAIIRRRQPVPGMRGRGVALYFLNPRVATHLGGAERDAAQAAAPPLLALLDGGKRG